MCIDRWPVGTDAERGRRLAPQASLDAALVCAQGKAVLTIRRHHAVSLWDATGHRLAVLPHRGEITHFSIRPDGKRLLTVAGGREVHCWDLAGKECGAPLRCDEFIRALAWSPDGDAALIACSPGLPSATTIHVWQPTPGKVIRTLRQDGLVSRLLVSPDGRLLLATTASAIAWWRLDTGEPLGAPQQLPALPAVCWAPDGLSCRTACRVRQAPDAPWEIRRWEVKTGRLLGEPLVLEGTNSAVDLLPDGGIWATARAGADETKSVVQELDPESGKPRGERWTIDAPRHTLRRSPDGKWLVQAVGKNGMGAVDWSRVWDAATRRLLDLPIRPSAGECLVAVSPDGNLFVTESPDFSVERLDAETGQLLGAPIQLRQHRTYGAYTGMGWHFRICAASPDGQTVLVRRDEGKGLDLFSTTDGKLVGRLPAPDPAPNAWYRSPVFSPDSQHLLTICEPEMDRFEVRTWDAASATPQVPPFPTMAWWEGHVAFSPDGGTVLLRRRYRQGDPGGTEQQFWDPATGRLLGEPMRFPGIVYAQAFNAQGRLCATAGLSTNPPGQVLLWQVPTGKSFGPPLVHPHMVQRVTFSPDGRLLLTVTGNPNELRLWDVATGKLVGNAIRVGGQDHHLAFAPNGEFFAVGGDGARIYRTPTALQGDVARIDRWVQVLTGLELDADGEAHILDPVAWQQRRQELNDRWGGPPLSRSP
jgi:WD40 repeat protein